jgi:predicted nucleic acid-binding protein
MREECQRVLAYPHLQKVAQQKGVHAAAVLAQFDALSHAVDAAPSAPVRCRDADDQCFIDLAVAHGATLVSKDWHVLKLRKRLKNLGVTALAQWTVVLGDG